MVSVKTIGDKIDFVRNRVTESAAYLLVIIINFIFTPIIEIKIFRKKFLIWKNLFSKADFQFPLIVRDKWAFIEQELKVVI